MAINYTDPQIIGQLAPLFGDGYTMLIFSAVVFGLGMRTVYRFYQERKAGNPDAQTFDAKFLGTAVTAFVLAGLPAMALMPSATATFNSMIPQWGAVFSWVFTALIIYSANAGINAAFKTVEEKTLTTAVKSGRIDRIIEQRMIELEREKQEQPQQPQPTENKENSNV